MTTFELPQTTATAPTVSPAAIRRTGVLLAVATATWASTIGMLSGDGFGWRSLVGGATSLTFQLAIVALLVLQIRTKAMGDGKVARVFHDGQFVLLAGAVVSTFLDAFGLLQGTAAWAVFDACWPLSMLGMVGIGIRIAIAGRWTGLVRWYTLWAQSWFVATIPLMMVFRDAGLAMGGLHLYLGYTVLGVILAVKGTVD